MSQPSAGPWTVRDAPYGYDIFVSDIETDRALWIASVTTGLVGRVIPYYPSKEECEANARLIAQAPVLLKALEFYADQFPGAIGAVARSSLAGDSGALSRHCQDVADRSPEFTSRSSEQTTVKAPHDLQALLATMKSAQEHRVNMNVWDRDIKTVGDAIATIEALREANRTFADLAIFGRGPALTSQHSSPQTVSETVHRGTPKV